MRDRTGGACGDPPSDNSCGEGEVWNDGENVWVREKYLWRNSYSGQDNCANIMEDVNITYTRKPKVVAEPSDWNCGMFDLDFSFHLPRSHTEWWFTRHQSGFIQTSNDDSADRSERDYGDKVGIDGKLYGYYGDFLTPDGGGAEIPGWSGYNNFGRNAMHYTRKGITAINKYNELSEMGSGEVDFEMIDVDTIYFELHCWDKSVHETPGRYRLQGSVDEVKRKIDSINSKNKFYRHYFDEP